MPWRSSDSDFENAMLPRSATALGATALILFQAACTAPPRQQASSRAEWQQTAEWLRDDPAQRAISRISCEAQNIAGTLSSDPMAMGLLAGLMGIEQAELNVALCQRLIDAIAQGTLTHADFDNLRGSGFESGRRLGQALRGPGRS